MYRKFIFIQLNKNNDETIIRINDSCLNKIILVLVFFFQYSSTDLINLLKLGKKIKLPAKHPLAFFYKVVNFQQIFNFFPLMTSGYRSFFYSEILYDSFYVLELVLGAEGV